MIKPSAASKRFAKTSAGLRGPEASSFRDTFLEGARFQLASSLVDDTRIKSVGVTIEIVVFTEKQCSGCPSWAWCKCQVIYVGYKNSKDKISEMDKLECYRLGWVMLV